MLKVPGLVAGYRFEGNANDSSGEGSHGTIVGSLAFDTGVFGKGVTFDGDVDSRIVCDPGPMVIGENDYSICFWIKIPETSTSTEYILSRGDTVRSNNASGRVAIYRSPVSPSVTISIVFMPVGTAVVYYGFGTALSVADVWTHLAFVGVRGDIMYVYVNGERYIGAGDYLCAAGDIHNATNQDLFIGVNYRSVQGYYQSPLLGSLDELQIYHKALSQSDVKRVMSGLHPLGA